jgi:hypothetical protein
MPTTRVTTVSHLLLLATVALPALALLVVLIAAFAAYAVDGGHSDAGLALVFVSPLLVIGIIATLEAASVLRAGAARASHVLVVAVGMFVVGLVFLYLNYGSSTGLSMGLLWLVLPVISLIALARDSRRPHEPAAR